MSELMWTDDHLCPLIPVWKAPVLASSFIRGPDHRVIPQFLSITAQSPEQQLRHWHPASKWSTPQYTVSHPPMGSTQDVSTAPDNVQRFSLFKALTKKALFFHLLPIFCWGKISGISRTSTISKIYWKELLIIQPENKTQSRIYCVHYCFQCLSLSSLVRFSSKKDNCIIGHTGLLSSGDVRIYQSMSSLSINTVIFSKKFTYEYLIVIVAT